MELILHAEYYRERADVYQKELWSLTAGCSSSWLLFPLKPCFVTYHNAFAYLLSATVSPHEFLVNHPDRNPPQRYGSFSALLRRREGGVFAEPQLASAKDMWGSAVAEVGGEVRLLYSATLTSDIPTYGHDAPQLSGAPEALR